jgi:hypothetical protein
MERREKTPRTLFLRGMKALRRETFPFLPNPRGAEVALGTVMKRPQCLSLIPNPFLHINFILKIYLNLSEVNFSPLQNADF